MTFAGMEQLGAARRRAAEIEFHSGGWLAYCEAHSQYQAITVDLVCSIRRCLAELNADSVLEVAAGNGALAVALCCPELSVRASDCDSGESATQALASRPRFVMSCFAPFDSGIDEAVLGCDSVSAYLVLNARCNDAFGSASLWNTPGWIAEPREAITRIMLTRFDVPVDGAGVQWIPHGEAWLFTRSQ